MAEKVGGRWQETFGADISRYGGEGMELVVTRKGVEVHGAYDSGYGGFDPVEVTWQELLKAKDRVCEGRGR